MQSNVTLKLDDALLKEVRKVAVDESMSLSGWVAGLIQDNLRKRGRRRLARRRALVALEAGFDLQPERFSRDELHER